MVFRIMFHLKCVFVFIKEEVLAPPPENDDVVNDFDIEEEVIEVENRLDIFPLSIYSSGSSYLCYVCKQMYLCLNNNVFVSREENLAKIARRVKDYKVEELNPPRDGKRLLVLDVDYTLFGESVAVVTRAQIIVTSRF